MNSSQVKTKDQSEEDILDSLASALVQVAIDIYQSNSIKDEK